MGSYGFETVPDALVLRAQSPATFVPSRYGEALRAGEEGLSQVDLDCLRADGLFPIRIDEEARAAFLADELPGDVRETLSLVKDPQGRTVLGSRRLTVRLPSAQSQAKIVALCERHDLALVRTLDPRGSGFTVRIPRPGAAMSTLVWP